MNSPTRQRNASTVLLAELCDSRTGQRSNARLSPVAAAGIKTILEKGSTALAIAFGEYLACYDQPATAAAAALEFQNSVEDLAHRHSELASLSARLILDVWPDPDMDNAALDRMRDLLGTAGGHCILLTESAHTNLDTRHTGKARPVELLGQSLFEIETGESRVTYREVTRAHGHEGNLAYNLLILSRRGKDLPVTGPECPFTLGRDRTCSMVLGGADVSRVHGRILHDKGYFHYEDDSRNGTYLIIGGEEVYVHNGRFPLTGAGVISPGLPLADQTGEVVRFRCEAPLGGMPDLDDAPSISIKPR